MVRAGCSLSCPRPLCTYIFPFNLCSRPLHDLSRTTTVTSATTASFVSALVLNSAVFGIEIGLFTLLRPYFKAIYEPRTYIPPPECVLYILYCFVFYMFHRKRVQPLSRHALLWPYYLCKADYKAVLYHNGLDAYFFVRFLRVMTITLIPIWLISWIILLPATSVNSSVDGLNGLDIFTFGNVESSKRIRYVAHLICVYGFTCMCPFSLVPITTQVVSLDLPCHPWRDGPLLAYTSATSH